ncbi:hemolysin III family protein [Vibrio sp. 10N.261.46.E12]|uniref:PAQR family membrane homeostasis protein TrhA n=1 Tax=unclassified Vibrio TaxID=2614977 RepID=UPI000977FC17|nr:MULTISPECIES: hemolysin III family protein [unclassified Vibrio]OMO35790.1 hemolysin III family protein [Vibrio sp. 10N.261.45.E1]PMJ21610.1 hemolysin III family protein [Vibrio sp. 10N.286.45.B6]PML84983.1 hemolysin III family protein [Vibrio sp. 10N.261.49.E11]PMM72487.1 hemolysin III family protein [Vibrio sp. 10N.261.46.F12]PMM81107.1 hemolysin III family protein [Vibrio sp. 10N.261.46.E8]
MSASSASEYSDIEERANAITHGLGVVLGVVGLILLLIRAFDYQADMLTVASMAIYGSSIILLFLASTLYHSITTEKTKRLLKTLDHCAIYLLIAGSYTPFLLVGLRTPLAIGLMAVIWGIALVGIIMKIAFVYRFKRLSLFIYLAMGWLSLIVVYQLAMNIEMGGLVLLALGGVIYSLGVIFYVAKRIPYNHAIWHLFVLAGCACHFFAIYLYVTPV